MSSDPLPPLKDIRVLELAGLAPAPFAGLLLADYGASVLRIDRPHPQAHSNHPGILPPETSDSLTRHKTSISIDLKSPASLSLLLSLISHADILIDPFRPGVLERLGLSPTDVLLKRNPRLIVARMTGFRRDGKYKDMAGHDINYIAVSGVLALLGRAGERPYPPGNIVGDFAGGGAMCFLGILLALLSRHRTGKGQVVEANMVDGSAYLATFPRLLQKRPMWGSPRGQNVLDGGCPYYDIYETKDAGKYFAVGALEPEFFAALLKGLSLKLEDILPPGSSGLREDPSTWPYMRDVFTRRFKERARREWESIFDGTDACATPVLENEELEEGGYEQRLAVGLSETPGLGFTNEEGGWSSDGLSPSKGGEMTLEDWCGWVRGKEYEVKDGALVIVGRSKL
ncbi:isopenicillin N-CoA epimerase [Histoplasma capsulatum]|uniref:Isopenicillin N-CoA epimerase n=1 Tax=Ajellomyces capsulatus TaxID=5037 RepID=A0A8A1LVS1_AJECA|nr:alpha-methylacyl-CoA racemase [Histoplasma mississippiense (nom. inval.)]EDN02700.1 alpha-methylacyl-CoA racemase [Histoplasma mississippiense (nom. inval.)]QSS58278.1 isopenicillin N-CoA epimerase [Histoplasma capsulatum]